MRLIKMISLAAVAAMAALAFVGAGSASAANTQLCNTHDSATALTCDSAAAGVGMSNTGLEVGRLLSDFPTILCLKISGLGTALALANPQEIHVSDLLFTECGTNSAHDNCHVLVLTQPLANLNKTGLDFGTLTGTNGLVLVECEDVDFFGTDIECTYDATNVQFSVGAQHLTAKLTPIKEKGSDILCPNNPTLDGLLKTVDHDDGSPDSGDTANRYVLA